MFQNNKILILGFARSGYQAAKLLIERGNEVYLNDSKKEVGHAYWSFHYIIAIHKDGSYVIAIKSPTTGEITPIGADCGNN